VIGDLIMIYRMYHIYNKSFLACAIPSITTAALFAVSCAFTDYLRKVGVSVGPEHLNAWGTTCLALTLFNSVFMSVATSLRLWRVNRGTAASNTREDSVVLRAMRVLVESVALWTIIITIGFIVFLTGDNLRHTFLDMSSPALGISFCLIIVRLGTITPQSRKASWGDSQRSRSSRMLPASDPRHSELPIPLERVKVKEDMYVSRSEGGRMDFHVVAPGSPGEKQSPV